MTRVVGCWGPRGFCRVNAVDPAAQEQFRYLLDRLLAGSLLDKFGVARGIFSTCASYRIPLTIDFEPAFGEKPFRPMLGNYVVGTYPTFDEAVEATLRYALGED